MRRLTSLLLALLCFMLLMPTGALAQGTNRLESIQVNSASGNKVELTLRMSDAAPTPLTLAPALSLAGRCW